MADRISKILGFHGFPYEVIKKVEDSYEGLTRHYHNTEHIIEMLDYADRNANHLNDEDRTCLYLAIIFHDVIYNTMSNENELLSANLFSHSIAPFRILLSAEEWALWEEREIKITELIMATKDHNYSDSLPEPIKIIIKADLERLTAPFEMFWENTLQIMKEYNWVDFKDFRKGRMDFLKTYGQKVGFMGEEAIKNIEIAYHTLSVWKPRIAYFCGSFDPFTYGHERVCENLLKSFDKVVIGRGQNTSKPPHTYPIPDRIKAVFQVDNYSGSIVEYLNKKEPGFTLVRGIRDVFDLASENTLTRWILDKNKKIGILYLPTDPDVAHYSSTLAREERKINGNVKTEYEV